MVDEELSPDVAVEHDGPEADASKHVSTSMLLLLSPCFCWDDSRICGGGWLMFEFVFK
jgi:hypothetical protein